MMLMCYIYNVLILHYSEASVEVSRAVLVSQSSLERSMNDMEQLQKKNMMQITNQFDELSSLSRKYH